MIIKQMECDVDLPRVNNTIADAYRENLNIEIEKYLAKGGQIHQLDVTDRVQGFQPHRRKEHF